MALSNRAYLRVPPDGAGKALLTDNVRYIEYNNAVDSQPFRAGNIITGTSSSMSATVIDADPTGPTSGSIVVSVQFSDLAGDFIVGEDLLANGYGFRARVGAVEHLYVSKTELVGANNPQFGQNVDVRGAASVRFPEGTPNFDAAGRTEVSTENWVGVYQQSHNEMPDLIGSWIEGEGTVEWDPFSATTELRVDDAAGSSVVRQTHKYHKYRAGVPMTAAMTVAAGAAQQGVVRRWGYFDEKDGLFFEYDGNTLFVVKRSSATGTVVEDRIPQSQWNGDRLDGGLNVATNPSQATLAPENMWLYEIGFLYLGAGPARFSVYVDGVRTTVHTFMNGGISPRPFMATGTLPLRWEIFNTDAVAGPTQLRQGNSTVFIHGDWAPQERIYGSPFREPVTVNEPTALAVIRAKEMTQNGRENRSIVLPNELKVLTLDQPIFVSIIRGGEYEVTQWVTQVPESLLEQAVYMTTPGDTNTIMPPPILSPGRIVYSHLIVPGEVGFIDLRQSFSVRADGEIRRDADITQATNWAVIARTLGPDPSPVTVAFNWREVL